jgi:protein phosphatase
MKIMKWLFDFSDDEKISQYAFGATDVGKVRENNEDYFLIRPENNLYIAADGMGGHNAGEVASKNAVENVSSYFTPELLSQLAGDDVKISREIVRAVINAHKKVFEMAQDNQAYHGMGCTIVVALIDGSALHLCHVGDARAYMCDDSGISLITTDHTHVMSLVEEGQMTMEEARTSPIKNELTQAIGAPRQINPGYGCYPLKEGDKILLCSDGLWDMLSDNEIHEILKQKKSAKMLCEELIKSANDAGGQDNITAVVIIHPCQEATVKDEPTNVAVKQAESIKES